MLYENFDILRNKSNEDLLLDTYNYCNKRIPIIVNNVNYWLDGEDHRNIPPDYFTNPEVMMMYQVEKIRRHKEHISDNYVPVLHPWYGTVVVPSALGVKVVFPEGTDPALRGRAINSPEEVKKLRKPDPYRDGLMPAVLATIDLMKRETDIPVCVTDTQGPLNVALSLAGVENLFIWFYTHPDYVHELMDFASDVIIDWVRIQKQHIGIANDEGAFPHGIYMPVGGVAISDDDITQIDEELYREFVMPYNSKVLKAFGGGSIHFCGSAMHQLEALASTDGLTAINNFCMGNFQQIYRLQEILQPKKIPLMVCDFAPLNVQDYYSNLFSGLRTEGTIVASYPTCMMGLDKGNYVHTERNSYDLSMEIYSCLNSKQRF